MNTPSILRSFGASLLGLLLVSCSATRSPVPGPMGGRDLSRYVLIFEEASDGWVTHSWKPLGDFDLTMYSRQVHVDGFHGRLEQVVFTDQECHHQYEVCVPTCLASTRIVQVDKYVYDSSQYGQWRTGKKRYCPEACMKQLAMCLAQVDASPVRFEAMDTAVDWVRRHRTKILAGTVIIIAGVAFIAVVGASGGAVLVFVPVVLVASSGNPLEFELTPETP
jgi:hypothetical protein